MGKIKIPKGTTAIRSEGTKKGYELVFETPTGDIRKELGTDIDDAIRLVAKLNRKLQLQTPPS